MNIYNLENKKCIYCNHKGELTYQDATTSISCAYCGEIADLDEYVKQEAKKNNK